MADLGWRADGIERALAAGGVELEIYRRPGFTGGMGVRRAGSVYAAGQWDPSNADPEPADRLAKNQNDPPRESP